MQSRSYKAVAVRLWFARLCVGLVDVARLCVRVLGAALLYASAVGLVVKYLVANEMPRVRFPDGAFSYAALLARC